jgi:hypothetical protein
MHLWIGNKHPTEVDKPSSGLNKRPTSAKNGHSGRNRESAPRKRAEKARDDRSESGRGVRQAVTGTPAGSARVFAEIDKWEKSINAEIARRRSLASATFISVGNLDSG